MGCCCLFSAGFVYVEHIDQLRSEQDELHQQLRVLEEKVDNLQREQQQVRMGLL